MYHGYKIVSMEIDDDDVIDDIINSKSISTIWTAVTWLVFKLERRTNKPTCDKLDWRSRCCTNFKIFPIITVVITILQVIIILEILASTQSPIAFSFVCLSVSKIAGKRKNRFSWNFQDRSRMIRERTRKIFGVLGLTLSIQGFFFCVFKQIRVS